MISMMLSLFGPIGAPVASIPLHSTWNARGLTEGKEGHMSGDGQ